MSEPKDSNARRKQLARLRQDLVRRFDEGELRTICMDLGVDYESLPASGKENKARELVSLLDRRGRIPELEALLQNPPPDIAGKRAPVRPGAALPGYRFLVVAGLTGFAVGVLGNLVAAWLQQELLKNIFTPVRVAIILALTLVGILAGAWLERHKDLAPARGECDEGNGSRARTRGLGWHNVRLLWSRVKSRGRGIAWDGVFSLGSEIDVDTREDQEDTDA